MGSRIVYAIIYFFSKMPFFMLYGVSNFVAFMLNHVVSYRKNVIINNLRNSFPEKTEAELEKIRIQFNKNFSEQIVETLKMFTISKEEIAKRLIYENPEAVTKYVKEGRSVMIASGHYGNWEYVSGFPLYLPGFNEYNVVYAPIENKYLNDRIVSSREQFGIRLLSKKETFNEIKKQPNHGCVYGFLFDQSPHKIRVKHDLQFLNQTTPVHLGTEDIAKMKNAIVFSFDVTRIKRGFYKAKVVLVTETPNETDKYEITHELFKRLEKTIKNDPAQWLWSHKRWKYKAGVDYNLEENKNT